LVISLYGKNRDILSFSSDYRRIISILAEKPGISGIRFQALSAMISG
jgi:hypothetical protein